MNPSPRGNWLALAVLDLLLTALGAAFVARAFLRYLAADIKQFLQSTRRRHYEN
jgi:hypothetical protein